VGRDRAATGADMARVMSELHRLQAAGVDLRGIDLETLGGEGVVSLSLRDLDRARRDPAVFADLLVGRPLWAHQLDVVASPARYRVICAGRRSGKSIVFGVIALHHAFAVPGSKVLIVSAGDVASKRLFKEIVAMASAPLLGASVADETTSLLTLEQRVDGGVCAVVDSAGAFG